MNPEEANDLPIDRLRAGTISDAEAIALAAEVVRLSRVQEHGQDVFNLLAARLKQVKLREEKR